METKRNGGDYLPTVRISKLQCGSIVYVIEHFPTRGALNGSRFER